MRVIALVAPGTMLLAALSAGPVLAQSSNTGPSSYDRPMRAPRPDAPSFVFPPKSPPGAAGQATSAGEPAAAPRAPVEPSLLPEDQARQDRERREKLRAEVQRDLEKAEAEEKAAREAADRKAKADAEARAKARDGAPGKDPGKPAGAGGNTIVIDTAACRWAQRHVAAADVEYRPGVDVHGNPVAPADLPGSSTVVLPREIQIGITADIARRFKLPPNALYAGEAYVGTVAVDTLSGKVTFNGQPIDNDTERELVALCAKQAP